MAGADATVDAILADWREALGADFDAYRNHAQRVCRLAAHLGARGDKRSVAVAAAFHDLGIWSDATLDYLEPSVARAEAWLTAAGEPERIAPVAAIIRNHHKLTPYAGPHAALVEPFRRADLADASRGLIRAGADRRFYHLLVQSLPYHGFHRRLAGLLLRNWGRHPLRPLPMFRW